MNLAAAVLGATAVNQLQTTVATPVLVVGRDRLTRGDLAKVGCFNFLAARHLTHALAEAVPVKGLSDLYTRIPPAALALPHLGAISLAVLGAAFEAVGIGGATPLQTWAETHAERSKTTVVTFSTVKAHERARTTKRRKRRRVA